MEKEIKRFFSPYMLIPLFVPAIVAALEGYFLRGSVIVAVRAFLVLMIAATMVLYSGRKTITARISLFITLMAVIASLQAFLPDFIVPIPAFGIVLSFVATPLIGILSTVYFAAIPFLVEERSFEYLLFLVITGIIATVLIYGKRRAGKYLEVILVFILIYVLLYTALIVMKRMTIEPEVIINPIVGLVLCIVIMEISGYRYFNNVVKMEEDLYKMVVDPEHPLLIELKNTNNAEYKRAIHTAHFTDLFAEKYGYDRVLMKGLGFYHRIGVLSEKGGSLSDRTIELAEREGFPPDIVKVLKEYGELKVGNKVSAEVSITVIVDTVIYKLMKEFEAGNNINMNKFIDQSILKLFSGQKSLLKKSALPYADLEDIRKQLKGEKMYYDFLR
ncbi:MAG: hypothetical protein K6G03_03390 [Lachnospiraceae bacterium]|nr:hypothetical protein [Lachnospiraceae bacterium]